MAPRARYFRCRAGLSAVSLVAGIDAGGTKLAVGMVDPDAGRLLECHESPTQRHRGGHAVLENCLELLREVSHGQVIAAIGVGVPELVSLEGKIQTAENWDWRDDSFRPALRKIAPLHIESDVRAAALAEARFGAGRALSSFLYLTIGTGVSHTFVVGGKPWRGARGNAIITGAPPVELVASGAALAGQARGRSGKEVLATPGDEPLVEAAARALGTELAALVNAFDPEAVVVGGGLGLAPGFMPRIVARMRPQIYANSTRDLAVHPCELGVHAGVIGAAVSAADALQLPGVPPGAPLAR
jgi:glucokinase